MKQIIYINNVYLNRQTFQKAITFAFLFFIISLANAQLKKFTLPTDVINFNGASASTPPIIDPLPSPSLTVTPYGYDNSLPMPNEAGAHNSIQDASGNIIFFIVNGCVYDQDGYLIDKIKIGGTTLFGWAETAIIPVPNSCSKYYIVSGNVALDNTFGQNPFPYYAVVDMTLPNIYTPGRLGQLEYFGTNTAVNLGSSIAGFPIFNLHNTGFQLAVSKLRASNDRFLFLSDASNLYRYIVDATGIYFDNTGISNPFNFPNTIGGFGAQAAEMELVELTSGDYRLAVPYFSTTGQRIFVPTISSANGFINPSATNFINVASVSSNNLAAIHGLEFSPNGNILYFTHASNSSALTGSIHYYNFSTSTLSPFVVTGAIDFEDSQIELGHDGHLYLATSNRLAVIKSPNTPSTSNWVNSYIALPNPYSSTPIGYECYGSPSTLCGALNPLYILPDQIDGENYFVSASIISYTAGTFPYTATTQTWTPTNNPFGGTSTNPVGTATNPILVLDKIVIPPGYNITIQGMTFKFKARTIDYSTGSAVISWGARVLVQNVMSTTGPQSGARLTLTSLGTTPSVFTSDDVCSNGMWEGVEVWGNHTLVQGVFSGLTAGKQGWFRMFNSSEISNAYIGALAGKKYYDATVTYVYNTPSFGGGIIQASSNSQFLNNSFGAYFMPYNIGNNLSYFTTVKFTTNQPFVSADNALPVNQVYMNDVKGIYFRTCTFFNDLSTSGYLQTFLGLTQVNMGIKAIHSQFYCIPNIVGSTNGCSFEGLKYGVYATFTSNAKTLTVDYGKFINNYRGAYLSAATLTPTVVRSSFHVMNYSHSVLNNRAYGLYLNACNEYKIEENYFTTYTGATTANNYGIIVNNSGPYPNVIKRNTFDKVYAGIQTQNQNCWLNPAPTVFNPVNDFGLQNRCNTFTSIKEMDMGITSGCVDFHQGTNGNPAGNNFSHSGNTAYNDYFTYAPSVNNQGRIGYWYDASPARTPLQYTPNPEITIANTIIDDPANHCKTSFSSFHLTLLIEDLKNKINDYQTKITDLKLRLDEGANGSLINAINSTMSAGNLKNLLMSKSPYLSDEILIAYFTKNGLPNGHLKEVAIVNSPLTADVKAILTTVSLPPGIRNQINAAQTTNQSKRQKTIDLVKYYQFEISILKNDMVRNYVNDSTVEIKIDTIISRVKEFEDIDVVSTVKTKEMLADLYIEKQDYVNAEDMILSIEAEPNKQNLAKLKRVHKNLKQSNQSVYDLPSNLTERQNVEDVAADNNLQGYEAAINILQEVFNQSYEEPIEELVPALHRYIPMEENSSIIANEPTVICFPNPANQSISFLYSLQDETDIASINIYNALGQVVRTIVINNTDVKYDVNIIDLPNGLYFYTLVVNSTTIANDKFVKSN